MTIVPFPELPPVSDLTPEEHRLADRLECKHELARWLYCNQRMVYRSWRSLDPRLKMVYLLQAEAMLVEIEKFGFTLTRGETDG